MNVSHLICLSGHFCSYQTKRLPWEGKIYSPFTPAAQACPEDHFHAADFRVWLHTASKKVNQYFLSTTLLFFFFYPKVLLSCMPNHFYLAGSASNIFWLFPKIKSTLEKKRGHVHSEDASKNVLEALRMNPKGEFTKCFELAHSLWSIQLLWRKSDSFWCVNFGCLSRDQFCGFTVSPYT